MKKRKITLEIENCELIEKPEEFVIIVPSQIGIGEVTSLQEK